MTSRDFAYWLQGYFEIAKPTSASTEVLDMIKQHLNMVFVHEIDPSHGGPAEQEKLNAIHAPAPNNPTPTHLHPRPNRPPKGPVARC